ncbi:MAG: hypothetical protein J5680_07195 [Neisseriaceae bacterium]|nr:hypothetical protein [Neisseriaceae bacterium]MBR5676016.1 hypothetical protein [Neisseriaceae bacterium]
MALFGEQGCPPYGSSHLGRSPKSGDYYALTFVKARNDSNFYRVGIPAHRNGRMYVQVA